MRLITVYVRQMRWTVSRLYLGDDPVDHCVRQTDALDSLPVVVCTQDLQFQSFGEHGVGGSIERAVCMIGES